MPKLIRTVAGIIADIEAIQKAFEFKSKDKYVKEAQMSSKTTVLAFSDCVVVNVALQSKLAKIQGTFDTVMGDLAGMALAQGQCVASGFFLRGGVDIGWWYRKGTVLASESLAGAYKAEGDAIVPVIRLTDSLYKWVSTHPDLKYYSKTIEPPLNILRQFNGIGRCSQPVSFWYIDYLSIVVESLGWETSAAQRERCMAAPPDKRDAIREKGYQTNIRRWLKHHARMISEAQARAKTTGVKAKYGWLAKYHNETAVKYTDSPQVLCSLEGAK